LEFRRVLFRSDHTIIEIRAGKPMTGFSIRSKNHVPVNIVNNDSRILRTSSHKKGALAARVEKLPTSRPIAVIRVAPPSNGHSILGKQSQFPAIDFEKAVINDSQATITNRR